MLETSLFCGHSMPKYQYFIKRLQHQELGSQSQRGGQCHRGRYVLIPKGALSLFPYLSEHRLNDFALIGLDPLYKLQGRSALPRCYCMFVYHNSFISEEKPNGRNEHRIYLSNELDDGLFFKGDIIVIRRRLFDVEFDSCESFAEKGDSSELLATTENSGCNYFIDWVCEGDPDWAVYDAYLSHNGGQNFTLVNERIDEFEKKVGNFKLVGRSVDKRIIEDYSKNLESVGKERTEGLYANLFNANSFRDFVLTTYGNTCAITNECISFEAFNNVEAAHIKPRAHNGTYLPSNGIAMRCDIHWAYDKGMFYIDPDALEVFVHKEVRGSYLGKYHGTVIKPACSAFAPFPDYLRYHKERIYGAFLHTGRITSNK